MIRREEVIPAGKFQKTHALKGELNLVTELPIEYFEERNPLIIEYDGILVPYYTDTIRKKGSTTYLIKLDGIDSETEASQFVNKEVFILNKDRDQWIEEDPEEFDGLVGYSIIDDATEKKIGKVTGLDDSTSNILFFVENENGDEIILPASEYLISSIDDETQEIYMKIPEGVLDINIK